MTNWQNESIEQARNRIRRKWGDYPLTILIINPINLRLARAIAHTDVTPNQLTIVSLACMVLAAVCLASVSRTLQVMGGALMLIAFLIDCLDGDLARLKGIKSALGAMLDPILDRFGEIAIILAIAINGWRTTQDPIWLVGGMFLMGVSQTYFYLVDAMVWKLPDPPRPATPPQHVTLRGTRVRFGAIEPFIWGQAALGFFGVAHWGVPIFAAMFSMGCVKVMYTLFTTAHRLEADASERYGTHTR